MDADLDTLCTVVYCTADDLLPEARAQRRRRVTDAEVVTLCVAQAIMGIPATAGSSRWRASASSISSRSCPPAGYHKRRRRLADAIEWLLGDFAAQSPGYCDDLLLIDSTPVECGRSRETRSVPHSSRSPATATAPRTRAGSGACACTRSARLTARPGRSRWPIPGATSVRSRSSCWRAANAIGCEVLVCDKGYAGRAFAVAAGDLGVAVARPVRKDEPGRGPHLAPIRQRIESIFWTCKDLLTLERHGARTLAGLRERVLVRFLCLAACISLNHRLGRPSRSLVDYCA